VYSIVKTLEGDGLVSKGRHGTYELTGKVKKEALRLAKIAVQASERSAYGTSDLQHLEKSAAILRTAAFFLYIRDLRSW
jgi:hypothetical protein